MSAKKCVVVCGLVVLVGVLVFNGLSQKEVDLKNQQILENQHTSSENKYTEDRLEELPDEYFSVVEGSKENQRISENRHTFFGRNHTENYLRERQSKELLVVEGATWRNKLGADMMRLKRLQIEARMITKNLVERIGTTDSLLELDAIRKSFDRDKIMSDKFQEFGFSDQDEYRSYLDRRYRELSKLAIANPSDLTQNEIDIMRELDHSEKLFLDEDDSFRKEFDKIAWKIFEKDFNEKISEFENFSSPSLILMQVESLKRYVGETYHFNTDLSDFGRRIKRKIVEAKQNYLEKFRSVELGVVSFFTYEYLIRDVVGEENVVGEDQVPMKFPELFAVTPEELGTTWNELNTIRRKVRTKEATAEIEKLKNGKESVDLSSVREAILEGITYEQLGTTEKEFISLRDIYLLREVPPSGQWPILIL